MDDSVGSNPTAEPKVHVINWETSTSFCGKVEVGDRGITLDQARDPDNDMYFDCQGCYEVLTDA